MFAEVIKKQVKISLNSPSRKVKHAAYKIFSGSLVKHYRMQNHLKLSSHMLRKYAKTSIKGPLKYKERTDKQRNRQKVTEFF